MSQLSPNLHRTLVAVAEAALPAGKFIPGAGEQTAYKVEQFASNLPGAAQTGLAGLLRGLDAQAWLGERKAFTRVAPERRLAILQQWRHGDVFRRLMLRALVSPLKIAHFDDPALYKQLGCVYDAEKVKAETKPAYMRDRVHAKLDGDLAVESDVVVIGTGAGGAVVGRELAEAGLAVVFVEEGRYHDRSQFTGRAFEMHQRLYRRGGSTFSVGNVAIPIPLGMSVGGTTTINSGTCYRTPDRILDEWATELGLADLTPDKMGGYFDRVEHVLQVEAARAELLGGNGRVIARGCDALGFTQHKPLRRNAPACDGQGVCCFGCPTDAKRSTNVSYIPIALRAGAELFTGAKVTRIIVEGGRARGVVAVTADGKTLTVRARAVVVACGAILTPLLLGAQQLGSQSGQLGKNLSIHPATGAIAEFDEEIMPWKGIPQGYAIEDLHDEGILFEGAMVPLEMTMSMTQLIGPELIRLAESFNHISSFGFMIEDTSRGKVTELRGQPLIQYWLTEQDVSHIKRGFDVLAQIYFAAGARRVHSPINGFDIIESPDDLAALRRATIKPWDLDLSAYHPLGTARMGSDPHSSVVGSDHQVHDTPGLYVVDGAAVPTSLGVNPQITIMALATRAAEKIAATLG
ncbi:MAG: GMC family oxidoreductase [Deltaproteobacteria bacterium]|nr:GMC family oxidoreductase [Deltaproteobacteria bacterium]MDQ3298160.1 GMC family oxidoreductase [Myxococcota bacterium]